MKVSLIVARAENGVIGKDNQMPWHLPADLQHFKKTTMGHPIIMGRKTYQSIGKALPGRVNIVVSRNTMLTLPDSVVVHTLEQAISMAEEVEKEEVFVIGGAQLYHDFLPLISKIYLTEVHAQVDGDTYFPDLSKDEWKETARKRYEPDAKNPFAYSFVEFEKVS